MPGNLRSWRVLVPSVVGCLLLVGGGVVARSAHQPPRPASSGSSPGASPHASSAHVSPPAAPHRPAHASASPRTTTSPSTSRRGDPSFDSSVAARSAELRRLAKQAQALTKKRREKRPVAEFTMASFNTLGASHTRHGRRANAVTRTRWMRDLLLSHHVDLVSLQEFQASQVSTFVREAAATYDVFPGLAGPRRDAENSVAWRKDAFELVKGETRPYPYFDGQVRNMPLVLLRHRASGVEFYVTSYHNPTNIKKYGNQDRNRARAVSLQSRDANTLLTESRRPLIIAGDMNDRATYFCAMTGATPLHSADGGDHVGGCHPPAGAWIDWILGSENVEFSGYSRDRSSLVRRTSDHPIVLATTKVTGKPGAGKHADQPAGG